MEKSEKTIDYDSAIAAPFLTIDLNGNVRTTAVTFVDSYEKKD